MVPLIKETEVDGQGPGEVQPVLSVRAGRRIRNPGPVSCVMHHEAGVRLGGALDWLIRDLRVAARVLARDRAFSLTAASTLAVCIGANAALFTVVHHVLLRGRCPCPSPTGSC